MLSTKRAKPPRGFGAVCRWLVVCVHRAVITRLGQGIKLFRAVNPPAVRDRRNRPSPGRGCQVKRAVVVSAFFRRPAGQNQREENIGWLWHPTRLLSGKAFSPLTFRRPVSGAQRFKSVYENAWRGRARLLPSCPAGSLPLSLRLGRSLALPRQAFSYTLSVSCGAVSGPAGR